MPTNLQSNTRYKRLLKRSLLSITVILVITLAIAYYLLYLRVTNSGLTFTNPLQIPTLLEATEQEGQKIFELTPQSGQVAFLDGQLAKTMGYNGHYLGPTIRVSRGDNVIINVTNQLDEMTTVHWHGLHVPPDMDGTPHQAIMPGETWQARYPILNEAATMWYHPHPHGQSAQQVFQGLAGLFIIDDENSDQLNLPNSYCIDYIPLIIQDRLIDEDGELHYELNKGAYYGDTILVNGTHNPFITVPAKQIRLRLLNGSNARVYHFGFDSNQLFHQIATDGGLLEAPVPTTRVRLSPGERAEIIVDLSHGQETLLKSYPEDDLLLLAESLFLDNIGNSYFDILKLVPESTNAPLDHQVDADLPPTLNQIKRWRPEDVVKVRTITLAGPITEGDQPAGPGPTIPINGKLMDMGRIDEVVTLGDVEIWEVTNIGGQAHPFHIHDIQFLILDRDGVPPEANEAGWKDTVLIGVNETVRFITQFTTYANPDVPYMYHCHILEHEDGGMMGQFIVIEPDSQ
ncbi:MAG: multicopper oxidase domain-containing protein [Chloroflexota bacterium]